MIKLIIWLSSVLILGVASQPLLGAGQTVPENLSDPTTLFNVFVKSSGKAYANTEEFNYRKQIFMNNLKSVLGSDFVPNDERVKAQTTDRGVSLRVNKFKDPCEFGMAVNKFFDLTDQEFKMYYLMPKEFFDTKTYKPVSKVVTVENGKNTINFIPDDVDPIDEIFKSEVVDTSTEASAAVNGNGKANANNNGKGNANGRTSKIPNNIFTQLKGSMGALKGRGNWARMKSPTDEGLTSECRQALSNKNTVQGGSLPNVGSAQNFNERKLQTTITYPPIYFQQNFNRYVTIDGVNVPTYLNWNQIAPLTPVKDQRNCNSCYVFSANAALEAHNNILNNVYKTVSEQEIIDCSDENRGCIGGQPYLVYDYVIRNGLAFDSDYAYTARPGTCRYWSLLNYARLPKLAGYLFPRPGVLNLIKALQYGPIVVVMYASDYLKYYYDGIYDGQGCTGNEIPNHSAIVYGYNLDSSKPHFLLKNNWGTGWGEAGHYRISIGTLSDTNTGRCSMAQTMYNVLPVLNR